MDMHMELQQEGGQAGLLTMRIDMRHKGEQTEQEFDKGNEHERGVGQGTCTGNCNKREEMREC